MSSNKYWKCYFGCETAGVLHRFPNPQHNEDKFNLWTSVLDTKMQKRDAKYIYNNLRLCDQHFELCYRTPNGKLTRNAVPTLNFDSHQTADQPLLIDEHISSNLSNKTCGPLSAPALTDTTQPLLKNELLVNMVQKGDACSLQDVNIFIDQNIPDMETPVPSSAKDMLISADVCKVNKQIKKKVYNLENKLKKMSEKYKTQTRKIKLAKNMSDSKIFLKYLETLPEPIKIFTNLQTKIKYKPRGRRYSNEEKILALSIFKQSAKAYNTLKKMFVLPSKRCLQKQLTSIPLKPGINPELFIQLKKAVSRLSPEKRLCTLIFDEVSLEPGLHFTNGQIVGFEDFGHKRNSQIADHALVFMLKSLKGKYKQPLCYTFCKSCTKKEDLKYLIKLLIREVHKTGLRVVATVCDQSQSNVSAIKSLKEETKGKYLRKELEYNSHAFEVDEYKIFPLFDTPHLLKGLRNNLLKKDAKFVENGVEKFAKWEHIKMLLDIDVGDQEIRLVNKLTEFHVLENKIPKMKVKYAAQVFSQRVSGALRFLAKHQIIPAECEDTARFLTMFDNLFDSFNGYTYMDTEKIFMRCLKSNSPHIKYWREILPIIKSIQFKTVTKKRDGIETIKYEKVPSISNWATNIETFMEMWQMLNKDHNITSLLTRNFNQDPLENFFSGIRSNGVRNTNPTCAQFINAYKTLMVNNLNSPHSVNANCEADDNKCFKSVKDLIESSADYVSQDEHINFNIDSLLASLWHPEGSNIDQQNNVVHRESKRYVAGYIVKKCRSNIFKSCPTCKKNFCSNKIDPASYTYFRDYSKRSLIHVNEDFVELTKKIYDIILLCLREAPQEKKLKEKIMYFIDIANNFNVITCDKHKLALIKFIINLSINIIVHSWCKDVNNILKGKIVNFPQEDHVKAQARQYYLKRIKNKMRN